MRQTRMQASQLVRVRGACRFGVRMAGTLVALLSLSMASPAMAFSYRPLADDALFDRAEVIVSGRIVTSPVRFESSSVYALAVTETYRGSVQGGQIRIVVPGTPDDGGSSGVVVSGAPRFMAGEAVLLFLNARDGDFVVQDLALGAFHEHPGAGGGSVLTRDFSGALQLPDAAIPPDPENHGWVRDAEAFRSWLRQRGHGGAADANYWRNGTSTAVVPAKFTLEGSPPIRWFEFDSGQNVVVYVDHSGLLGLLGGGYSEVKDAIAAWDGDPQSNVRLSYGGETTARSPVLKADGLNEVMFNDPYNDIPGSYSCDFGGVVATAAYHYSGTQRFNGVTYGRITESDVVVQDGVACLLSLYLGRNAAEVITHELGHSLGLGHSCGDSTSPDCVPGSLADAAIMRTTLHSDGRGAALGADDRAALSVLYPVDVGASGGSTPGSDGATGDSGGGGAIGLMDMLLLLCGGAWSIARRTTRQRR